MNRPIIMQGEVTCSVRGTLRAVRYVNAELDSLILQKQLEFPGCLRSISRQQ